MFFIPTLDKERSTHLIRKMSITLGLLNISDRASRGEYDDTPGKLATQLLRRYLVTPFALSYHVIPDDQEVIEQKLRFLADEESCALILTTGGTGPAPRDVTPEATGAVCEKMLPGFGEQMRMVSLRYVPTAILSRQTAGIRGRSLIVNLPGKPKAVEECLEAVFPAIPYAIDLIGGPFLETDPKVMPCFRPGTGKT